MHAQRFKMVFDVNKHVFLRLIDRFSLFPKPALISEDAKLSSNVLQSDPLQGVFHVYKDF